MITNENDFLGLLISCADENHNCDVFEVISESGMSDIDLSSFYEISSRKRINRDIRYGNNSHISKSLRHLCTQSSRIAGINC